MLINAVAPFAGAWIEMGTKLEYGGRSMVAPFAGAWIEILKNVENSVKEIVAPFAGAWIEIPYSGYMPLV